MAVLNNCEEHKLAFAADSFSEDCPACVLQNELDEAEKSVSELETDVGGLESELEDTQNTLDDLTDEFDKYKEAHPSE